MASPPPFPTAEQFSLLSRVITTVARSSCLQPQEQEDFAQSVHLKLLERSYDTFHKFRGGCSLKTFLTVVVRRLLLDWRNATLGKWRPSTKARRLGAHAVRLERLIYREGYDPSEAIAYLCVQTGAPPERDLVALLEHIPPRQSHRSVSDEQLEAMPDRHAMDPLTAAERWATERALRRRVRRALVGLPVEDRRLLSLRFYHGHTVQDIARLLGSEPKSLYRRYDRLLAAIRSRVRAEETKSPE
jgi:RNA polymerase sigma factor (sigma-70 family)